jgi:hypothetical protein
VGERFAGTWLHQDQHRPLTDDLLEHLRARLQPGDVLLMRAEGKLTASLLPGFWAHAAIYLGKRNSGFASHLSGNASDARHSQPPGRDSRIPHGVDQLNESEKDKDGPGADQDWVIEAVSPCVRIASLKACLDADHVLVLRPRLTPAEMGMAIQEALCHLHKPYDFEFDFNLSSRVVCTGLVFRSFHGRGPIAFELVKRLGNYTLTGDDLVEQATAGGGMTPVLLMLRRGPGWSVEERTRPIAACLRALRRGWRPLRERPG